MKKIAVIGDGGWGTTLSILLYNKGYNVSLWSAFKENARSLNRDRVNKKYLKGIPIPKGISVYHEIEHLKNQDVYIVAVPCQFLRKTMKKLKHFISGPIISVTKGIELDTLKLPSQVIKEVMGAKNISVLSGPTIAYEVARNMPTACVVASENKKYAEEARALFTQDTFRVYCSSDVKGVELSGALKNVIAIAAGITDGMGFGINTKASLLTRGLAEMIRLGVRIGAKKETFSGLSGLGDLTTTCMSFHSRNRWLGEQIGVGKKVSKIIKSTVMVIEGYETSKAAHKLAGQYKVDLPIASEVYKVLHENKSPKRAISELMNRSLKWEA